MIPIYGFLQFDTIGLLILAEPADTAADLIKKVQQAAAVRVAPRAEMQLRYQDKTIPSDTTVEEIGLKPLDHIFVHHG